MPKLREKPIIVNGQIVERIFTFIIYPDSVDYDCVQVLKLVETICPEYAYILHDKDNVKSHYHVLVRFDSGKSLNVLANDLGIKPNIIKWRNNFKESFKYLTHENKKGGSNKYKYPRNLISTNLSNIERFYASGTYDRDLEADQVLELINFIEKHPDINTKELVRYAVSIGAWATLRRGGRWFADTLREEKYEYEHKINKNFYEESLAKRDEESSDLPKHFTRCDDLPF